MSVVFVLGMTMTIVGLICSWNDRYRPTAAQVVCLIGAGMLLGFGLTGVFGA